LLGPKRQRKMLSIADKVKLLEMLREGKSYAAVGRHYEINESSVPRMLYQNFAESDREEEEDARPSTSAVHAVPCAFNASKGWFENFKKRFGLRNVSLHGEMASANAAEAEAFVCNKFKEEVKAPGFKAQKDRLTLIMCGYAAGFMIKPGLIYRSKNPRTLKNKNKDDLPVYWMYNAKAWMTKALNLDWFKNCFIPQVKCYLRGKGLDFKVLLLVDNAGGHADDLAYDRVQIKFLPPNTTSLIQPMDQGIIRAFKALYTRNTLQHLVDDYWRGYTIASCLQNIQRAIKEMKTETLNACWKKLWPEAVQNPTGGSLDEVHHSAVDAAVNLAKQLGGDGFNDICPDDINALIDADAHPLTDADLAEMTTPQSDDEREEEEEDTSVAKDEEEGLTLGRLATMVGMATELQRVAQEWDPLMSRSLQFSNIINGGMSVYKDLFAKKKKKRQQLPITMFLSRTNTPAAAPQASEGKNAAEDAAAQYEEQ
uniref:DDE-1 domain-containing protein n=1 Tax=Oryzias latipes TaxID=8090 RepID=A0A3P9I0D2_ORYLA